MELLEHLYGRIVTTQTVAAEVKLALPDWISIVEIQDAARHASLWSTLDPGEASALALAHEVVEPLLILDDLAARKAAEQFGFPIIGTLGILEEAKLQGVLKEIRPILDELKQVNFRVSKVLEEYVLHRVGEL